MEKQKLHALIEQTQDLFENWDTVLNNVPFSLPETSVHTYNHCRNVLRFALMIGLNEKLNTEQLDALACACVFHDCGRSRECWDPRHGKISADKYKAFCQKHEISFDERVYLAIYYHSLSDTAGNKAFTENNLYGDLLIYTILKDADALDRYRFDDLSALNKNYLRTNTAKDESMIAYARSVNQHGSARSS